MANDLGLETFKLAILNLEPNNSDSLQNWFSPEIYSPIFNLWKFSKSETSTPESCRMLSNIKTDEEFGSLNLLKLKHGWGDQIIQTF